MKIAIVLSDSPRWPKMIWVAEAAESEGHEVRLCYTADQLREADRWADLTILQHKSPGIRWPNLRSVFENRQSPFCYWWFDLVALSPGPIASQAWFQQFKPLFLGCDFVFVKERGLVDQYRDAGVNAHWLDQGCPHTFPQAPTCEPRWDVVLYGQAYRERTRAVQALQGANLRVLWIGNPKAPCESAPWVHPDRLPEACGGARFVLSIGRRSDLEGYWSDSLWLALGMGKAVLRSETPGLPPGPYCTFRSLPELVRLVAETTNEADTGRRAREWVMREHTVRHRLRELISIVRGGAAIAADAAC